MLDEKEIIETLKNLAVDKYINERKLEEKDVEAIINIIVLYSQEKEKNKELEKENKKLNLIRLEYLVSSFPDTTETYKKYKKELDELLKEE